MKKLIHLGAVIVLTFSSLAKETDVPGTIVIDNPQATFGLGWTVKKPGDSFFSKDGYGTDYSFANMSTRDDKKTTAIYRPKISDAGTYNVEIYYPAGDNRSSKAPWVIHYQGGESNVFIDQKKNGGKWQTLAKNLPFAAGTSGYVELHNLGETSTTVVADAVRFVPVSTTAPEGKTFKLTVNTSPGGTVLKNPDTATPAADSTVLLIANADSGYVFDGWSGNVTGFKNPLKLLMSTNKTVTASFIPEGVGVIMDNPAAEFGGPWKLSSTNWGGAKYEDYQFASAKANAESSAVYRPNIPKSGKYDIYIWYASGPNRSSKAPWTVYHKGSPVKTTINQQNKGGEWVSIASGVEFEAGKKSNQYVELNNGTGDSSSAMVVADAVAFIYTGE